MRALQIVHGSEAVYRRGCRCDTCVQSSRRRTNAYRARIRGGGVPHLEGKPVSAATFTRFFCRCNDCRSAYLAKREDARLERLGRKLPPRPRLVVEQTIARYGVRGAMDRLGMSYDELKPLLDVMSGD